MTRCWTSVLELSLARRRGGGRAAPAAPAPPKSSSSYRASRGRTPGLPRRRNLRETRPARPQHNMFRSAGPAARPTGGGVSSGKGPRRYRMPCRGPSSTVSHPSFERTSAMSASRRHASGAGAGQLRAGVAVGRRPHRQPAVPGRRAADHAPGRGLRVADVLDHRLAVCPRAPSTTGAGSVLGAVEGLTSTRFGGAACDQRELEDPEGREGERLRLRPPPRAAVVTRDDSAARAVARSAGPASTAPPPGY